MAQSIEGIKKTMTDLFIQNESVQQAYQLTPGKTFEEEFSKASIESILFYCVAFCAWILENIFDTLRTDLTSYVDAMKPHTPRWYANKAKEFMYGHSLVAGEDYYNTSGLTDEQIKTSKVVKYSAVTEHKNEYGRLYLRMKVAGENATDLAPLDSATLNSLRNYLNLIKDAGIDLRVESNQPDRIKMGWKIYYDPLLLDANGNRLDGSGNNVVRVAIKEFLKNIAFNGVYAIQKHEDFVQQINGVVLCPVLFAQSAYGEFDWVDIDVMVIPDAGFMRFDLESDLQIEYIPYNAV